MRIKKLLFFILILGVFISSGHSSVNNSNEVAVYANASVYPNPVFDSVAFIEFPFNLNRDDFQFFRKDSTDSNYYASIFAFVKLFNVNGVTIDSTQTVFSVKVATMLDAKKKDVQLFNKLALVAKPGIYSAQVIIVDIATKHKGEFFISKIEVPASSKSNSINFSSLNSAFNAVYVGNDSSKINPLIYKSGYNLFINPVSVFADSDKSLYIYGEIYNLEYTESERTKYQLIVNALDKDKNIYQMFGSRLSKKPGSSAVVVEKIDITGWNKGNYTIEVIAVDLATQASDTAYLPISIVSPVEVMAAAETISKEKDLYNTLTLTQKIQLVTYILTNEEKRTLDNLGEKGKENFLNAIWREHDNSPSVLDNPFRDEIIKRYLYVNQFFSTNDMKTNGWLTDRGRVYMQYGRWEQREDKEFSRTGLPFEVWYYHSYKGGGLTFIFQDFHGDDDYKLVHSNADGEVYSKKWADWITTGYMDALEK